MDPSQDDLCFDPGKKEKLLPYVWTLAAMFLATLVLIGIVLKMRPDKDNTSLLTMIIGFCTVFSAAVIALIKLGVIHRIVNSRMSKWMTHAMEVAREQGRKEILAGLEKKE